MMQDLEDPSKTCVFLPAVDDAEDSEDEDDPSVYASQDFPGGYEQRLGVYRKAWASCLERIQAIVHALQAPIVEAVADSVRTAHLESHQLPGLPYPELPVVAVSSSNSAIITDVASLLESGEVTAAHDAKGKDRLAEDENEDPAVSHTAVVTHLYLADCPNLLSAMKSIITSFVDRQAEEKEEGKQKINLPHLTKRKPTASLANFDLNLLRVWYKALSDMNDDKPNLVVVLHNFEQYDASVMEDVFTICSQHLPELPLVFLLAMSSPSPSAYMKSAFSRQTLALLRLDVHGAATGVELAQTLIEKTFFDLEFTPPIMLGPGTLEYLADFCSRHCASADAVVTILQLAFMKHFEEPFTVFVLDDYLDSETCQPLLRSLMTRLWSEANLEDPAEQDHVPEYLQVVDWEKPSSEDLLTAVDGARAEFQYTSEQLRLGYCVLRLVHKFMRSCGYRPSVSATGKDEPLLELLSRLVRGRLARDVKHLGLMVKKLPGAQLDDLLAKLYSFFYQLEPAHLRTSEREFIVQWRSALPKIEESTKVDAEMRAAVADVAAEVAAWLMEYLEQRLVKLDDLVLGEVWSTGSTPFPSELINPAPRPTILSALLHPHETLHAHSQLFSGHGEADVPVDREYQLWELPDTSILFRRYMEAGRMINVYDWFESFAVVLDSQRQRRTRVEEPKTPRKGKGKAKAKVAVEEDEEDEEEWKVEVQARFIRALHELDFMGFLKHTGRKADHVVKTVYDIPD